MDHEFKVRDATYRAGRMSALDALEVARKWSGPLLFVSASEKPDFNGADFAKGFVFGAGSLQRYDTESCIALCLGCVQVSMGGDKGWAPVASSGVLMNQGMEFDEVLEVVFGALRANRLVGPGSFFAVPPSPSGAKAPQ